MVLLLLSAVIAVYSSAVYSQNGGELDAVRPKKILVVGDSLSAAYKLPVQQGWVHLLRLRLESENYSYKVINASISGATTAAGLQLVPESLATHRPDIVLLELGANDGLQGKPVSYISKNLDRLITLTKASGAEVVLIGIRLPPNFGSRYTEPFFQQYQTLAQSHGLPLVPFLLEGIAGSARLMMEDGLHPNAEAQAMILENVWPTLRTVL